MKRLRGRYRSGIRGYLKTVVQELLKMYLQVEKQFQHGSYDACVMQLRDVHRNDLREVTRAIFSHAAAAKKNLLVIELIDFVCGREPGLTDDLKVILTDLTMLNKAENAKVRDKGGGWGVGGWYYGFVGLFEDHL